jgi:hypothetical protein
MMISFSRIFPGYPHPKIHAIKTEMQRLNNEGESDLRGGVK